MNKDILEWKEITYDLEWFYHKLSKIDFKFDLKKYLLLNWLKKYIESRQKYEFDLCNHENFELHISKEKDIYHISSYKEWPDGMITTTIVKNDYSLKRLVYKLFKFYCESTILLPNNISMLDIAKTLTSQLNKIQCEDDGLLKSITNLLGNEIVNDQIKSEFSFNVREKDNERKQYIKDWINSVEC